MANLEFPLQLQKQDNWCWAAISVSVDHFFNPASPWEQCRLAGAELGLDCCQDGSTERCNQVRRLDPPLTRVGRLRERPIPRPLTMDEIREEIDGGRPVCARIQWRDGGGHFVLISGYEVTPRGVTVLTIDDPAFDRSRVKFEKFLTDYHTGHGKWTGTFRLQS
jgi:hypothetical protein